MKKREHVTKALLSVLATAVEDEMEVYIYSWPPLCASLLYQPKRPEFPIEHYSKRKVKK